MILGDIGLVLVILTLAAFMVWRLADLFKTRGRWHEELQEAREYTAQLAHDDQPGIPAEKPVRGVTQ